jgi:hypothetical protein
MDLMTPAVRSESAELAVRRERWKEVRTKEARMPPSGAMLDMNHNQRNRYLMADGDRQMFYSEVDQIRRIEREISSVPELDV